MCQVLKCSKTFKKLLLVNTDRSFISDNQFFFLWAAKWPTQKNPDCDHCIESIEIFFDHETSKTFFVCKDHHG